MASPRSRTWIKPPSTSVRTTSQTSSWPLTQTAWPTARSLSGTLRALASLPGSSSMRGAATASAAAAAAAAGGGSHCVSPVAVSW